MFMLFLHGFMAVDGGAGVEKQTITVLMNEFFITWGFDRNFTKSK